MQEWEKRQDLGEADRRKSLRDWGASPVTPTAKSAQKARVKPSWNIRVDVRGRQLGPSLGSWSGSGKAKQHLDLATAAGAQSRNSARTTQTKMEGSRTWKASVERLLGVSRQGAMPDGDHHTQHRRYDGHRRLPAPRRKVRAQDSKFRVEADQGKNGLPNVLLTGRRTRESKVGSQHKNLEKKHYINTARAWYKPKHHWHEGAMERDSGKLRGHTEGERGSAMSSGEAATAETAGPKVETMDFDSFQIIRAMAPDVKKDDRDGGAPTSWPQNKSHQRTLVERRSRHWEKGQEGQGRHPRTGRSCRPRKDASPKRHGGNKGPKRRRGNKRSMRTKTPSRSRRRTRTPSRSRSERRSKKSGDRTIEFNDGKIAFTLKLKTPKSR